MSDQYGTHGAQQGGTSGGNVDNTSSHAGVSGENVSRSASGTELDSRDAALLLAIDGLLDNASSEPGTEAQPGPTHRVNLAAARPADRGPLAMQVPAARDSADGDLRIALSARLVDATPNARHEFRDELREQLLQRHPASSAHLASAAQADGAHAGVAQEELQQGNEGTSSTPAPGTHGSGMPASDRSGERSRQKVARWSRPGWASPPAWLVGRASARRDPGVRVPAPTAGARGRRLVVSGSLGAMGLLLLLVLFVGMSTMLNMLNAIKVRQMAGGDPNHSAATTATIELSADQSTAPGANTPPAVEIASCPAWVIQDSPSPGAYNVLDAVGASSPDDAWAVGYYSDSGVGKGNTFFSDYIGSQAKSLILRWDGKSWSHVPSPNPGSANNLLHGVAAISRDDAWAVGSYIDAGTGAGNAPGDAGTERTLILHWDGKTWQQVPSPSPDAVRNRLFGIVALSKDDIWAVGAYGQDFTAEGASRTLVLHWDGKTWQQVPSPSPGTTGNVLYGVAASGSNDAWAVGVKASREGQMPSHDVGSLMLRWNGSRWSEEPVPQGGNMLTGVGASAGGAVWAVGALASEGSNNSIILRREGVNWTGWPIALPGASAPDFHGLNGVVTLGSNNAWAVGFHDARGPGAQRSETLVMHWDGSIWSRFPTPNRQLAPGAAGGGAIRTKADQLNGIAAAPVGQYLWAVGYSSAHTGGTDSRSQTLILTYASDGGACPTPTSVTDSTAQATPTATPGSAVPATPSAAATTSPAASSPPPSTSTPLTPTPIQPAPASVADLEPLIEKAEVIAHVRVFGYNQEGQDAILSMEIQPWATNPKRTDARTLYLHVPPQLWDQMPASFQGTRDPMGNSGKNDMYVMFLSKGPSDSIYGADLYYLTDGPQGAFLVRNGKIGDSAFPQYNGMNVDDFKRLITGEPTPIPTVAAQITPTRLPNSPPVSLARESDGFRLDVHEGSAYFGSPLGSPWVGPSRLLVEWVGTPSSPGGSHRYATYILDTANGKLVTLPGNEPNRNVFLSPDGNRAVMVWQSITLRVAIYDFRSGELHTVIDIEPGATQWAGPAIDLSGFRPGTEVFVDAVPVWAGNDRFALNVMRRSEAGPESNWNKALLVDIPRQEVRALVEQGIAVAAWPDGSVLLRGTRIDGAMQLFRPGDKSPRTIVAAGPWNIGWSVSPDGNRVAWLEMTPPPGDWSERLPSPCCSDDPLPIAHGIVVWDHAAGKLQRLEARDFAGSTPDVGWSEWQTLRWSNDSSALFYAAHPSQGHTRLYRLSLNGQATALVDLDKHVGFDVIAEGDDGSVYYLIIGMDCQNCSQLTRRRPDGAIEAVHPNGISVEWRVDEWGHLEVLKDGGVTITDLSSGQSHHVNFPGQQVGSDQIGWSTVSRLIPVSPDGRWAAYAGSQSDAITVGPDGRSDRGRTVYVVRVK